MPHRYLKTLSQKCIAAIRFFSQGPPARFCQPNDDWKRYVGDEVMAGRLMGILGSGFGPGVPGSGFRYSAWFQ